MHATGDILITDTNRGPVKERSVENEFPPWVRVYRSHSSAPSMCRGRYIAVSSLFLCSFPGLVRSLSATLARSGVLSPQRPISPKLPKSLTQFGSLTYCSSCHVISYVAPSVLIFVLALSSDLRAHTGQIIRGCCKACEKQYCLIV